MARSSRDEAVLKTIESGRRPWRLPLRSLAVVIAAGLTVSPGHAQESTPAESQLEQKTNTGRDPTNLPSTYGVILSQAKFASGDRLRSVSLRGIHKFDRDYVGVNIPFGDFVPGTPSGTYTTGLGDIVVDYFHVFPYLSEKAVHGLGLLLQLDTATNSELGSGTTVIEPFYALSYYERELVQIVFVARYLRNIGAGFATPITDTVLLSPFVLFERPGNWYAQVKFNNFIDLTSNPNTFTSEVGIGNVIGGHYNVGFFYEFPLNHESRVFNVQARFTLQLLYQF